MESFDDSNSPENFQVLVTGFSSALHIKYYNQQLVITLFWVFFREVTIL